MADRVLDAQRLERINLPLHAIIIAKRLHLHPLGLFAMNDNDFLKQLLLIGIGTTSLVAEKVKEVTENWVENGRLDPSQASALIEELMAQIKTEQGNIESQLQRQLRLILQDIGVPRQSEMDELRGRLDRLERQLRDIENRLWK